MTFGLTPNGFNKKRLPDEKASEENALIAEFGDINLQPQSVFGQFVGVMSKAFADVWENLEDVYFSQYPGTAEGVALDYLVALNGLSRQQAQKTTVTAVATGTEGTLINAGALARQPTTNETFTVTEDSIITSSASIANEISVIDLSPQVYTLSVDDEEHFYSLPKIEFDSLFVTSNETVVTINGNDLSAVSFNTDSQTTIEDIANAIEADSTVLTATPRLGLVITFDDDFVTDNEIVVTINGIALNQVDFTSDQSTTMTNLASEIQGFFSVTSCTVTGARELTIVPEDEGTFLVDSIEVTQGASQPNAIEQRIDVVPVSGSEVTIDEVDTTGGASQPDADISFLTPDSLEEIVEELVEVIFQNSSLISATDNENGTFEIEANDNTTPYSLSVSSNMQITDVSSLVPFEAQEFGAVPAPISSLTQIITAIAGWDSINNLNAGVVGRNIETDAELRVRRRNSTRILGAGTVEAIRSRILNDVDGVTQVLVVENKEMKQENTIITFIDDFVTGNSITFTINGVPLSSVNFDTDQLTTMQLLEVLLEAEPYVDNVTISGANDRVLTIEFTSGFDTTITDIQISGGASQTDENIQQGRFPKSFEAIVQGGSSEDIANTIWLTKPAGIQTFGNTSEVITDSMGFDHSINFSRPTPIYIWIDVDLTLYDEEDFPSDGVELVKQAIVDYGNTLNVGEDVLNQRVLCQIFEVSGIASGDLTMTFTLNPGDTPTGYSTNDISIGESQIAVFDLDRTAVQVV